MRVFLDSNVLLSAALWPDGTAAACYRTAVSHEHIMFVSDDVVDEIREVTARKFSDRVDIMDHFLASLLDFVGQVATLRHRRPTKMWSEMMLTGRCFVEHAPLAAIF